MQNRLLQLHKLVQQQANFFGGSLGMHMNFSDSLVTFSQTYSKTILVYSSVLNIFCIDALCILNLLVFRLSRFVTLFALSFVTIDCTHFPEKSVECILLECVSALVMCLFLLVAS